MTDTELILQKLNNIESTLSEHTKQIHSIHEKLDLQTDQIKAVDDSIGMLAEWADSVAVVAKVPFASGGTQVK